MCFRVNCCFAQYVGLLDVTAAKRFEAANMYLSQYIVQNPNGAIDDALVQEARQRLLCFVGETD